MASQTRYVVVFNRWVSKGGGGRWAATTGVMPDGCTRTDARYRAAEDTTIGVYEVDRAATRDEAQGQAMAWLARGRPADMTVREVTT